MGKMLIRLLELGHEVCIESSRLVIRSANNKPVPDYFLEKYSGMFQEILNRIKPKVYEYYEYSVDNYDGRYPGLSLQFRPVFEGVYSFAIFNVELTRERDTKAGRRGERLPPGHFRIKSERCGFYQFWLRSGARFPRRLSAFHDYMGRLKGILFTAECSSEKPERLDAKTIRPLSISAEVIRKAFLPDMTQTNAGQTPDKLRTILPDKVPAQSLMQQGIQADFATGAVKHGKAVNRGAPVDSSLTASKTRPEDQSEDEWLRDYCSPASSDDHAWGNSRSSSKMILGRAESPPNV
ncbi:hypothetical protein [Pseudomonas sp. zfem002]|uniref:hypothetical protein n=1 Tax=Pseudomonas sp. zfem002 TaxID=3078197 RepID=UPI002927767C|nr:hypothetical protein [Pseudomonas sp. zfem002]MDU9390505.1 hypothetical protein [Pseudomonas sp. zfem002]